MLVSMTGFGQSQVEDQEIRVSAEVRSVNHRFLDVSVKLPRGLASLEAEVRDLVRGRIARGRVTVTVELIGGLPAEAIRVNVALMERYLQLLRDFAQAHGLEGEVDLNTLASLPDVFSRDETVAPERWAPLVRKAVEEALAGCMDMKIQEGKALEQDMKRRVAEVEKVVSEIETLAPEAIEANRRAYRERLEKFLEGVPVDRERWMTEMAILADRLDFTEELTRLKSHLAQLRACLQEGGTVSKRLTYLLQEVHREASTLGTKACDARIAEGVVRLKEEVEKLREQAQNVE